MTVVTIRPDSTVQYPGSWSLQGGSSDADDALRDDTDVTYLRGNENRCDATKAVIVGFANPTPPVAAHRIKQVRVRARIKDRSTSNETFAAVYLRLNDIEAGRANNSGGESAFKEFSGAWQTQKPGGGDWTATDVNALQASIYSCGSKSSSVGSDWAAVYIDVEYNETPVVTVTTPTEGSTIQDQTRPTGGATYADTEGDAMTHYRFKVFSAAQYGAGGFDPETSAATYDSGWVASSTNPITATPTTDLSNGAYRYYFKARQGGSWSTAFESAWDYNQFTVVVSPPLAPTITATADDTNRRIALVLQGQDNLLTLNDSTLESTVGSWTQHVNATAARTTAAGTFASGSAGLSITATIAGNAAVRTASGTSGYRVSPGLTYVLRAKLKAAATAKQIRLYARFYDAAGTAISFVGSADLGLDATGAFTAFTNSVVAPALAAYMAVIIEVQSAAAGGVHYADEIGVFPQGNTAWNAGGMVSDVGTDTTLSSQRFLIEYSDDGGDTWETADRLWTAALVEVDGSAASPPAATQALTLYDYEAFPRQERLYRAQAYDIGPPIIAGPYSAEDGATYVASEWAIHVPSDPSMNVVVYRDDSNFDYDGEEPGQANYAAGRRNAIVVKGDIQGENFPLTLQFEEQEDFEAFEAIRDLQEAVFLITDMDLAWYVAFLGRRGVSIDRTTKNAEPWWHTVSVTAIEQDRP